MPALAELQRWMAGAILHGELAAMPALASSPIAADAAFAVHRDTVLGGLAGALRLTFPTVDALVGEAFFNQMALAYVADQPPRGANLSFYGENLPAFIEAYAGAASLTYLADVARLDLAISRTLMRPDADVRSQTALDAGVLLSLPVSLAVLALQAPAELIRDGVEADDDQALAAIDLTAAPRWLAVWRAGRTASVLPLSPASGRFLAAIVDGDDADAALAACAPDPIAALQTLQAEVFASPFAQIIQTPPEDIQP